MVIGALGVGLWATQALSDDTKAPTSISAKSTSPTSVSFTWKGSPDADSYVVKIGSDRALHLDAQTVKTKATKATKGAVTVDNLPPSAEGAPRFYRVDAVYNGKIASSRIAPFALLPGTVDKLKVAATNTTGARIEWKQVPNVRQYDVVVALNKDFTEGASSMRTLNADHTFITNSLRPGTIYWIKVRPTNSEHLGVFSEPATFATKNKESSFKVGTWNVCSEVCSGYASRGRIQAALLNENKIDMFGLQEAGGKRVGRTTNAIFSGGSQKFVRANGGRNTNYIFFRPALFEQLGGNNFLIGHSRSTTWAKFRIRATGSEFYFVDIHLSTGKDGVDGTRRAQMQRTLSLMASLNKKGLPMVYAGDFNAGVHRAYSPGILMNAAGFTDSVTISQSPPVNANFNSGHTYSTTPKFGGKYVDHIYVSKDFAVLGWKQLVRVAGNRYTRPVVSDHNALSAEVQLKSLIESIGDPTPTTTVDGLTDSLP